MMEEVTGQKSVILGLLDKGKDEKKSEVRQKAEASILATAGDEAIPAIGVTRLITQVVEDFCSSAWPGERIQGLFALRELTFVLEKDRVQCYVQQITKPVLLSFSDEDAQVRYKACEAFYNIAKVMRSGILQDMGAVFDGLCRLYTDVEQNIKEGAQSLDRLVRDIVVEQRHFDYSALIPLITSRIHVLNPSVRQLVLGWIVLLDSLPQVDMIAFLPHYLEGLFGILASDNRDFRLKAFILAARAP
ncbi:unnamed protein product [Effrenium voratum]|nr:unnamed protein product [Effrenium voratum]